MNFGFDLQTRLCSGCGPAPGASALRRTLAALILAALLSSPAGAQTADAGSFLRLTPGTRALALGGAYTAQVNDPTAGFWNAAGLARGIRSQAQFNLTRFPFDRSFGLMALRFGVGRRSGLGVGWYTLQVQNLEARRTNTIQPDFTFASGQHVFYLAYARRMSAKLSVGAAAKGYYSRLAGLQASGFGLDVGVQYLLRPDLRLGFAAHDLGASLRWSSGRRERVTPKMRLGIAHRIADAITAAVDIQMDREEGLRLFWGMELMLLPQLPLRLGLGRDGPALGTGMQFRMQQWRIVLDYALSRDALLGNPVHHFGVRIGFSSRKKVRLAKRTVSPPAPKNAPPLVQVVARTLNVRAGPGRNHKVIDRVHRGARFRVIDFKGKWARIRLDEQRQGWVHRRYIVTVDARGTH